MATCKSCGAEIRWIKMASGKVMPVNAEPVAFSVIPPGVKGAQTYVLEDGRVSRGVIDPGGDKVGYISHFATCPAAALHRRRD